MQAPMLVLKNTSKRESGRKVQISNIQAAKTISDVVNIYNNIIIISILSATPKLTLGLLRNFYFIFNEMCYPMQIHVKFDVKTCHTFGIIHILRNHQRGRGFGMITLM